MRDQYLEVEIRRKDQYMHELIKQRDLELKEELENKDQMWKKELRKRDEAYWQGQTKRNGNLARILEERDMGVNEKSVSRDQFLLNSMTNSKLHTMFKLTRGNQALQNQ